MLVPGVKELTGCGGSPSLRRPAGGEWVTAPQAVRPGGLSAKGAFVWTLNRKKEMREVHSVRIQGWMLGGVHWVRG